MNPSIIDPFLTSNEIKEFEDKIVSWLVKNFNPKKEGFDSQSDSNMPTDERLSYILELEYIFEDSIDLVSEKYSTDIAKYLYDTTVKTLINNYKIFELEYKIDLEEITSSFLSAFESLKRDDPEFYGNQISFHQFFPETFDYISNQIACNLISSDWVVSGFWKDEVFQNIMDIEETRQLKFAIKSMILFIELFQEQKKRLDGLKS